MGIPGFTADASLYKTSGHYYMVGTLDAHEGSVEVLPQLPIWPISASQYCWIQCDKYIVDGKRYVEVCYLKCETPIRV